MSKPGKENPPNKQYPQSTEDTATSSARGNGNRNPRLRPRTLTNPPMQIHWQNLQEALGPAPPLPPLLRPRAPPPAPLVPPIMSNFQWRCSICRAGFFNVRGLSGHMRVHKERNWKGIHPPPELCKPQFGPGSMTGMLRPSLVRVGGPITSSVGDGSGMSQHPILWAPSPDSSFQCATGNGGDGSFQAERNLGKSPAILLEVDGQSEPSLRNSEPTRGGQDPPGQVPDLNVNPSQSDEYESGVEERDQESEPELKKEEIEGQQDKTEADQEQERVRAPEDTTGKKGGEEDDE